MKYFSLIVFFLFSVTVFASIDSQKDSLMSLLEKATSDTSRINYYVEIGYLYDESPKAEYWFLKAIKSCDALTDGRGDLQQDKRRIYSLKGKALNGLAFCYQAKEDYLSSILAFNRALQCFETINDSISIAITRLNNGNNYFRLCQYSEALNNYQKAAIIFNKLDDLRGEAFCYNDIGGIHSEIGNINLAIEYWKKTLTIKKVLNDSISIAKTLNNMGVAYKNQNNYDLALQTFKNALLIFKSIDNQSGVAMVYMNMANLFQRKNEFEKALKYANLSLDIKKMMKDENGMAIAYGNISNLFNKLEQYHKAKLMADDGVKIALKIGLLSALENNYRNLSLAYAGLNDMNNAYQYLVKYDRVKDSLFTIEKNKEFTKLETQYQIKNKQQEIEKQQAIIKKKEAIAEKNRMQRNFMFGGIILMVLLLGVVIYSYLQKKKDNAIISEKNQNLEIANTEIMAQRDEIEAQRDLVDMQKQQIEYIHGELKDSITYGKRIQESLLPSIDFLKSFFEGNYFVFFRPRDVVSGDFYWTAQVDEWRFFTVADCTGHGVPGAFMSMLGISLLNEIVREKNIRSTAELLNILFSRLSQNLHQRQNENSVKDSIDIAFCAWNTKTNELQFSGINNPLYFLRNNQLKVIQPTKMINIQSIQDKAIALENLTLQKGDIIVMSTDGYIDQFGGEKGKKFKKENFLNLIYSLTNYPISEHQKIMEKRFLEWKGTQNQIDDVCVMGVKFDSL